MIASKDVPRLASAEYIDCGTVIPKPARWKTPKYGKWAIVFSTRDGDELMQNQRGQVYLFGTIDSAAAFLFEQLGQTEIITDLEYECGP